MAPEHLIKLGVKRPLGCLMLYGRSQFKKEMEPLKLCLSPALGSWSSSFLQYTFRLSPRGSHIHYFCRTPFSLAFIRSKQLEKMRSQQHVIRWVCGDHQAALHRLQLEILKQLKKSWFCSLYANTETL